MKRIFTGILMLIMLLLCGCNNSNTKKYNTACGLFVEGKYAEAKAAYEALGDYQDSAKMAEICTQKEIENLLQGRWNLEGSTIVLVFESGRYSVEFSGEEKDIIDSMMRFFATVFGGNEAYWIDFDTQTIYTCSDKTEEELADFDLADGHVTLTTTVGYKKQFTYTYENGKFQLLALDKTADMTFVKQENIQ